MKQLMIFLMVALMPMATIAQDDGVLSRSAMCRVDGIQGGNYSVNGRAFDCFTFPEERAREVGRFASHTTTKGNCPPVDPAWAAARCAQVGKVFNPSAPLDVRINQEDGRAPEERGAFAVQSFDTSGRCTMSRVRGEYRNDFSGSCLFQPRKRSTVTVRSYCGYICQ